MMSVGSGSRGCPTASEGVMQETLRALAAEGICQVALFADG
jgi:hypothetical protein